MKMLNIELIQKRVESLGFTYKELAKEMKMTLAELRKLFKENDFISFQQAFDLAYFLKIKPSELSIYYDRLYLTPM